MKKITSSKKESKLAKRLSELLAKFNLLKYEIPKEITPKVRKMAEEIIARMKKLGYDTMVYQGFRSITEQNYLYEQGRTRPGTRVTNAKGGQSFHNYGVAVDIVFLRSGKPSWAENHPWATLGKVGKEVGFEWGGDWIDFVDRPHFELLQGHKLSDFINKKVDYSKWLN